ncbi:MAG TPA: 30S ribosomal protein S4 [Rhodocyclaceae bacterium]|nr:30S ribosomal protein S4 [Rhodocyclaceae bacterium]
MSRYTGPRLKVVRALGTALPGLTSKATERQYPPGQHGQRQRKKSDYGIKLMEKQKLRFNYGVTETQIRRLMTEAKASREQSGKKLLELLERRIDNAVFRAGFAPTIVAARQLVRHKHVLLNGKLVNIPSIRVKVGDTLQMTAKGLKIPCVIETLATPVLEPAEWVKRDEISGIATVVRIPDANEVPFPIEIQHVVEYYAVRL